MITERIERAILLGKATWNVVNIAIFDTATIKVPKNGFVILNQIIWNHFCDALQDQTRDGDIVSHTIHGLSLVEKGQSDELYYNIRTSVKVELSADGALYPVINGNAVTIIPTYKIFKKDICIDISRISDMTDTSYATGKMSASSEERSSPIGFGTGLTGIDVVAYIDLAVDHGKYYPNGDSRLVSGATQPKEAGAKYRDQYRNPTIVQTKLNTGAGSSGDGRQNMPPFISLGMWKFTCSPEEFALI